MSMQFEISSLPICSEANTHTAFLLLSFRMFQFRRINWIKKYIWNFLKTPKLTFMSTLPFSLCEKINI